jgi:hypothetical protein
MGIGFYWSALRSLKANTIKSYSFGKLAVKSYLHLFKTEKYAYIKKQLKEQGF